MSQAAGCVLNAKWLTLLKGIFLAQREDFTGFLFREYRIVLKRSNCLPGSSPQGPRQTYLPVPGLLQLVHAFLSAVQHWGQSSARWRHLPKHSGKKTLEETEGNMLTLLLTMIGDCVLPIFRLTPAESSLPMKLDAGWASDHEHIFIYVSL